MKLFIKKMFFPFMMVFIIILSVILLNESGLLDNLKSIHEIKNTVLRMGKWSEISFVMIQFLQVTIIPIPAILTTVLGTNIFGAKTSFLLSTCGILLGSYFAFFIGRVLGKSIVERLIGEHNLDKYKQKMTKNTHIYLALAFLLPVFPDDILCLIAGLLPIKFRNFFLITLITRPISILVTAYVAELYPDILFNRSTVFIAILIIAVYMLVKLIIAGIKRMRTKSTQAF